MMKHLLFSILIFLLLASCKNTDDGDNYPCPVYDEDMENFFGITNTNEFGEIIGSIDYDDWHFSGKQQPVVLTSKPVVISDFKVQFIDQSIIVTWQTQSETDNDGWNILRNTVSDFSTSEVINPNLIEGSGTCCEPTDYEFIDESGFEYDTTYYYWLQAFAMSGETYETEPYEIIIPSETLWSFGPAYPNPGTDEIKIPFSMQEEKKVTVIIIDEDGDLIETLVSETREIGNYELSWFPESDDTGLFRCIFHVDKSHHWYGDIEIQ